jgi:hypothetical protein
MRQIVAPLKSFTFFAKVYNRFIIKKHKVSSFALPLALVCFAYHTLHQTKKSIKDDDLYHVKCSLANTFLASGIRTNSPCFIVIPRHTRQTKHATCLPHEALSRIVTALFPENQAAAAGKTNFLSKKGSDY